MQSVAFDLLATAPMKKTGTDRRTRTSHAFVFSEALYRMSYVGRKE